MSQDRKLLLPDEFPYLGRQHLKYRVVKIVDQVVTVKRNRGQLVDIPISFLFQCHDDLMSAPDQTLPLQEIIKDVSASIRYGESVIGAVLVAAGLAKVLKGRSIRLRGIS
jgi:hypothetical protein